MTREQDFADAAAAPALLHKLCMAEHGSKQLVLSSHNLVRATYMARTSLG